MAEIVEVIHRINYEINDNALQNVSAVFARQINDILRLQGQLINLQKELSRTADNQTYEFEKISRKISNITQLLQRETGKSQSFLEKYGQSIVKGLGLDTKIGQMVSSWVKPAQSQLAGLGESGLKTAGTLAMAAGKLNPIGRIVSTAIPIVLDLATSFFKAGESTKKLEDSVDGLQESRDKIAKFAADEISELFALKAKIEDVTTSYGNRMEAVRQLKEQNPGFFEHLKQEEILAGKVGDAYERVVKNILLKAQSNVLKDMLEKEVGRLMALKDKMEAQATKEGIKLQQAKGAVPGLDRYSEPFNESFKASIGTVPSDNTKGRGFANAPIQEKSSFRAPSSELARLMHFYNEAVPGIEKLLRSIVDIERQLVKPNSGTGGGGGFGSINRPSGVKQVNIRLKPGTYDEDLANGVIPRTERQPYLPGDAFYTGATPAPGEETKKEYVPSKLEKTLFGKTSEIQDPEERRRAEINKSIDAYQALANAAVQAFQTIYDAQIKALDAEIAIRQKRVEAATKLAEKGNTEVLKIEQERLDKAQKQREEFARRQQIVNAALAVSNAVLAVASAASQTGPGAIAVVPAVIAAIIAGYAAISAATQQSTAQAFADGVVGFRGKGGPREDANWVRISSGESVITAKGTAANRSILEAINKGAEFRMLDAKLLSAVPSLSVLQTGFASKENLKSLEKKLDGVIEAVKDNQFKQDIFFNEHGVGLMTQRAIRKDQNRFK